GDATVEDHGRPPGGALGGPEEPDRPGHRVRSGLVRIQAGEPTADAETPARLAGVTLTGDHPHRYIPRGLAAGRPDAGGRDQGPLHRAVAVVGGVDLTDPGVRPAGLRLESQG